jgi:citrate lyase subunit beta/citryl-CoA lyase
MIFEQTANLPESNGICRKEPCKHNLYRSNMMLNPLMLKHINRIDEYLADTVTLNLEDAIAPTRKSEAMRNIALFLSHCQYSANRIVVRVNPIDSGGTEEIEYLNDFGFDAIRLSKVASAEEIHRALDILAPDKELHISIETSTAFRDLSRWHGIDRLTTANLGILDLLADLGLPHSLLETGNGTVEYILTKFLIDSKTAGIRPVGFMFQDYNNVNEYERWLLYMQNIGYSSASCMGPKQVHIANRIFSASNDEIPKAQYIKEIYERNSAENTNGFMDEKYGFIDEPVYRNALNILTDMN